MAALKTIWQIAATPDGPTEALATEVGVSKSVANVLMARGLDSAEKVSSFCRLSIDNLHDPLLLPDIHPALDRICTALDNGETIHVHGDYDVDGVTSTAIVVITLRLLGANPTYCVPHRIKDGYDLKDRSVQTAIDAGASVLITVDCGIQAFNTADRAREKGVDLIITDHHQPSTDGRVPRCIAVINPNRKIDPLSGACAYPFSGLAGAGIAYKLMTALWERRGRSRRELAQRLMDFVALGTVSDVASMVDENRIMVYLGCVVLNQSRNAGVTELLRVAGVDHVDPVSIGFQLGPRINAVGRLADSMTALHLLLETDPERARVIAGQMDDVNGQRKELQEAAFDGAWKCLPEDLSQTRIVVVSSADWHPGVVGLVAGALAEKLGRPAIVCALFPDGTARGSCRSTRTFNIYNALKAPGIADLFIDCGGHAFAAGFTIAARRLPELEQRINDYALAVMGGSEVVRTVEVDAELPIQEISTKTLNTINRLAPFGEGNREPVFMTRNLVIERSWLLGQSGKHLKILLGIPDETRKIYAVAWRRAEDLNWIRPSQIVDVVYTLEMNKYNNGSDLQLNLIDVRLAVGALQEGVS